MEIQPSTPPHPTSTPPPVETFQFTPQALDDLKVRVKSWPYLLRELQRRIHLYSLPL